MIILRPKELLYLLKWPNLSTFKILRFCLNSLFLFWWRSIALFSKPADLISILHPCLHFHFMALFAFQLNLISLKISWSYFQEHNSAEYQITCYSKSFKKLQSVVENGIHHFLEKIPHKNFIPWNWHTTTTLGLSNK